MFGSSDNLFGQMHRKLSKRGNIAITDSGENEKLYKKKGEVVFQIGNTEY